MNLMPKDEPRSTMPATTMLATTHTTMLISSIALGFIAFAIFIYTLSLLAGIIIPFLIAVCFCYLINVISHSLTRITIGQRHLPQKICFFISLITVAASLWSIVQLISGNIAAVAVAAPHYQHNFQLMLPKLIQLFPFTLETSSYQLLSYLDLGAIIAFLAKHLTGLAGKTIVVFFYTTFLLYEQRYFKRKFTLLFADSPTRAKITAIISNIDSQIQRYLLVKVVISSLTGSGTYLILSYFNVDFSQFWGLLAFMLNFIPYAGSIVAAILPALISLVQFGDVSTFVLVLLSLTTMQLILGNFLDPRLLGENLNLSPSVILLTLACCGMLWGVPGMFLAVPILVVTMAILAQFHHTRAIAVLLSRTGEITEDAVL